MKTRHTLASLPVAGLLCLAAAGCLNLKPSADPTRYFLLTSIASDGQPQPPDAARNRFSLGIAPVTVPAYLAKPWMVVRASDTEIRYSDFNKWGEYLDNGIQRTLAENLGQLLGTDRVSLDSWKRATVDAELRVAVRRFDVTPDGQVVLEADWEIRGQTAVTRHHVIRKTGPDAVADPAGAVKTMSKALGELSRVIAQGLRSPAD